MAGTDMPLEELLKHLQRLAEQSLSLWDMPGNPSVSLINVSENATYLVEADGGYKAILRIHREDYHTRRAIECELAWIDALGAGKAVTTPGYHLGKDGVAIQEGHVDPLPEPRFMVLFEFVDGAAPNETGDMTDGFEDLGAIAARCHNHAMTWPKPEPFERLTFCSVLTRMGSPVFH